MPQSVSLDQIMSERQFSTKSTEKGDALTKIYKAPASWNQDARSARFIMTAEIVDRYGDIVVTKGVETTEFEKNPVTLWAHNARAFPIGMWSDLKKITGTPRRLEGTTSLAPEETVEEADTAAKLIAANLLRACSIGFIPTAWESIKDDKNRFMGYKFLESELLECSICGIPANPAALIKAAGGDDKLALQAIDLVLEEWARTPDGLIVPRSEYERAYEIVKGKEVTLHEVRTIVEDEAPAVEVNPLDIAAAVSRGISEALGSDTLMNKIRDLFGIKPKEVVADPVVETPAVVETATAEEDDGETEEQFQERLARQKAEADLADEQEELAARARAMALTS